MPCAQQGRVYETIGRQQWLAAGLLLSVPWVLDMTSIKCPTRLLKGTAGYMLCFLFIFNDLSDQLSQNLPDQSSFSFRGW